ncbi:HAD family hydrolase [Aristophania vespae]|uniref:HAD family hydrolase n=1 Tax=Aristophania vespae TaxID=2697033 RepID=UPI0023515E21|nr:HAD family phosphatase [Aristophania vespae]UMM64043.1 6-phosphogluconate phosphatase [Aristophania vespae]
MTNELRNGLKFVIFDCDGVLIDSERPSCRATAEFARSKGVHVSDEDAIETFAGMTQSQVVKFLEDKIGSSLPEDTETKLRQNIIRLMQSNAEPIEGAMKLLEDLRKHNIPFAVGSNSSIREMDVKFGHTGMDKLIPKDRIYSANDMGCPKPAPDVYLYAAKQHGVSPEETLVVEDSDVGAESVRRAGMSCLLLRDKDHKLPSFWPTPHFVHITNLSEMMPLLLPKLATSLRT